MGARGPKKGHGGRPRKKVGTNRPGKLGYARRTVGPKGRGKQKLAHRVKAGAKKGQVVHHKDHNKRNNSRSNLKVTTRAKHTAHHNRHG